MTGSGTDCPHRGRRPAAASLVVVGSLTLGALALLFLPPSRAWLGVGAAVALPLAAAAACRAPELVLILFLFAGQYKAIPILSALPEAMDLTVLLAVLLLLALARIVWQHSNTVRLDRGLVACWLCWCLLMVASLLWTPSHNYGLSKSGRFLVLSSLALLAPPLLVRGAQNGRRLVLSLAGFAGLYALSALPAGLSAVSKLAFVSVSGANYLGLGRIAGAGAIVCLLYVIPGGGWQALAGAIALLVTGVELLLSGGRGPVLAFVIALPLAILVSLPRLGRHGRRLVALGLTVALIALALIQLNLLPATLAYRLSLLQPQTVLQQAPSSAGERLIRWRAAWEAITTHPLGLGSGGYSSWYAGVDERAYPHNILLEAAAELGLPGLLVVLCLFCYPLLRILGAPPAGRELTLQRLAALGLFLFAWANAMVSGDFNDNRLAFMATGLLLALCALGEEDGQCPTRQTGNCTRYT